MNVTEAQALRSALDAYKPQVAGSFVAQREALFARVVEAHGPTLRGVGNCWTWAKVFRNALAPFVRRGGGDAVLLVDALAEAGAAYADAVIEEWLGKIMAKLGELEDANVERLDSATFRISGQHEGKRVDIEQTCIVNVSKLGMPFNQFPARIYLNGKHISEAAYKKMRGH